ncbi:MAG: outer membrane beta-barrel protein [Muribaculaceae bacterium]|nr:outer membrane beta-barrel protein [Muribaculaceae bacterium]
MNNDFIDIMHERLSQHQMPEPVGLWHDIAIALDANQKKKDFNLARWGKVAAVAAAIIAVAVMFQVLRNQEPQATFNGNEVAKTETPRTDVKMPSTSPEEDTDDIVDQSLAQQRNVNNSNAGKATAATTEHIATEPAVEENIIKTEVEEVAPSPQKDNQEVEKSTTPPTPNQQGVKTPKNEQREPLFAINSNTRIAGKKAENKINVSLYYSGISTISNQVEWDGALNSSADPPGNASNPGQTDEPQYSNNPNDYNYYHQVPIRVGAKVAFNIGDKWRIGSGLIFTRLKQKAKAKVGITYQNIDGTFNYLGLPAYVSRDVWRNKRFQVYANAGAMMEFNLNNHMQITRHRGREKTVITYDNRDHRPQFSINAGIGAQYNIIDKLGIYMEPGISYYFNNGSDIYNLYKDKPFNFDFNLGIRLNIGK